jgi:hypothetical protein
MKTTKFVLVITFVAFAAMIYAQADRTSPTKPAPHQRVVKIALEKAVLDRGLKIAIYKQVQPGLLLNDQPLYFTRVYYHRTIYLVYGSYGEWKAFLKMAIEKDPER